jgi:hypothetical protein
MQDEITSDLARLADLKVVGSQSTGSYVPNKKRDLRAVGRDLGVRYLLEGDVWRANSELDASLGRSTFTTAAVLDRKPRTSAENVCTLHDTPCRGGNKRVSRLKKQLRLTVRDDYPRRIIFALWLSTG